MNILLLGNGFDLYHHLPTSYLCFLSVAKYLKEGKPTTNIKEVFESTKSLCKEINESYETYKSFYESYLFDEDDEKDIKEIRKIVNTNLWIKYLINSFNKDVGWIDFEKEITLVLKYFSGFLNTSNLYNAPKKDLKCHYKYYNHIITQFNFFFDLTPDRWLHVKDKFIIEEPYGSGIYSIDKENIFLHLFHELLSVSKALLLYLKIFVDKPTKQMKKLDCININPAFSSADFVVNYNYTHTYETLFGNYINYKKRPTVHIHGTINTDIVLGINADEKDEIVDLDTSTIMFKKYYQRIVFRTDNNYSAAIQSVIDDELTYKNSKTTKLIVCGHSLDITDKDTLDILFEIVDVIIIVYHTPSAIGTYVKNLSSMYGKHKFDLLRREKNLTFIDYNELNDILCPQNIIS